MLKRLFVAAFISMATLPLLPAAAQSKAPSPAPAATLAPIKAITGYAPVNGMKMYYEVRGRGKPLVVLHGAVGATCSARTCRSLPRAAR